MTQTHDLQSLLEGADLERFRSSLEHELNIYSVSQLKQLKNFEIVLSRIGMTKSEIEKLKKLLKKNGHNHGPPIFSRLKKIKMTKAGLSLDSQTEFVTTETTPCCQKGVNIYDTNCVCSSCRHENSDDYSVWHKMEISEAETLSSSESVTPNTTAPSPIRIPSGQMQTLDQKLSNSAPSIAFKRQLCDIYTDFPNKFDMPKDRPKERTPSGGVTSSTGVALTALSGVAYYKNEGSKLDDKSPLLRLEAARVNIAKNTFDNVAAIESASISRNSSEVKLTNGQPTGGRVTTTAPIHEGEVLVNRSNSLFKLPDSFINKKKQKPKLKIAIPNDQREDPLAKLNIKPMSNSEAREIDEAIQLASNLSRMTVDHCITTSPRSPTTPGSRESLPSSGVSESPCTTASSGLHFRFPFRKKASTPKEDKEKKTFVEFSNLNADVTSAILTPEALEAYEKLVTKAPDPITDRSATDLFRHDRTKIRRHNQKNSFSESDRMATPANGLPLRRQELHHAECSCRNSAHPFLPAKHVNGCLVVKKTFDDTDAKVLKLFQKSPLNQANMHLPDVSKSPPLSDNNADGRSKDYKIVLPSPRSHTAKIEVKFDRDEIIENSDSSISTCTALPDRETISQCITCEASPTDRAPSPPPALPPRIPLRTSTLNRGQQRRNPMAAGSNGFQPPNHLSRKKRSHSEGVSNSAQLHHCLTEGYHYLPMRETRSTELDVVWSVETLSFGGSSDKLNSTQGSENGSVFAESPVRHHPHSPNVLLPPPRSPSSLDNSPQLRHPNHHHHQHKLSMSVREVKVDANELGINDTSDKFWNKTDNMECQSESDLQWAVSAPIPGRYETSDCVSYEDLMEFALDMAQPGKSATRDEIRLMMKMFPNNITEEDCTNALNETNGDLHSAVKLLKLKQLLSARLADKQQCKEALMICQWDVDEAASYLLAPSQYN